MRFHRPSGLPASTCNYKTAMNMYVSWCLGLAILQSFLLLPWCPEGAALFIFPWLALHIFTHSRLGVSGVSQWSVFIQHQLFPLWFKAYHDTFETPQHVQRQIGSRTARREPRLGFVDLTSGIVKHKVSIISRADHSGDRKHLPLVTDLCSLKAIMPLITLDISWMSVLQDMTDALFFITDAYWKDLTLGF